MSLYSVLVVERNMGEKKKLFLWRNEDFNQSNKLKKEGVFWRCVNTLSVNDLKIVTRFDSIVGNYWN